jgi:hypothetical protein
MHNTFTKLKAYLVGGGIGSMVSRFFQRGHINDEAVFYVVLHHPVIGFIDFLDGDELDISGDVVLTAKIQHFLGLLDAIDERTAKIASAKNQASHLNRQRFRRQADLRERPVPGPTPSTAPVP